MRAVLAGRGRSAAAIVILACVGCVAEPAAAADIDVHGTLIMDALYDFDRIDPDWHDTLRTSLIPVTCPGDAGCGPPGESVFSIRQSRASLDVQMPSGLGDVGIHVSADLFGVGNDAGKATPHLLAAWAEVGRFSFGQMPSVFMDITVFPDSLDYWGPPGMIFFRNVQMRWRAAGNDTFALVLGLEAPLSSIDSGKAASISPALDLRGKTEVPDVTGHVRWSRPWGHVQLAGILRNVGYESTANPDGEPSGEKLGWGLNLSGTLELSAMDSLVYQAAYGRGIGSYLDDGGLDLAPDEDLRAETLKTLGYLLFYRRQWNEQFSTTVGWSGIDVDNAAGQLDDAIHELGYGLINLLYRPDDVWLLGVELLHGRQAQFAGAEGEDTRLMFSFRVSL